MSYKQTKSTSTASRVPTRGGLQGGPARRAPTLERPRGIRPIDSGDSALTSGIPLRGPILWTVCWPTPPCQKSCKIVTVATRFALLRRVCYISSSGCTELVSAIEGDFFISKMNHFLGFRATSASGLCFADGSKAKDIGSSNLMKV